MGTNQVQQTTETTSPIAGSAGKSVVRFFFKSIKLWISICLDIFDFTVGRLLGFGIMVDFGSACICAALWGKAGWWHLWEVIDVTEQLDGFVPTCTIIALSSWRDD